jgi:signal peptidase I
MNTENQINTTKKRSILLSILLSIITPGLGHLYNGKLKLALFIPISFIIVTNVIYHLSLVKSFLFLVILVLIFICTYLFAIIHSAFLAKKNQEYSLKYFNKTYLYILFVIFYFGISGIIPTNSSIGTSSMPTDGMENTILVEDMFLSDMDYYANNQLRRNDLVLFLDPRTGNQLLIKRVIAVEGDSISILNGKIFLNDQLLNEDNPNIIFEKGNYFDLEKTVIPSKHFFCIGDNRPSSLDSRMFGSVSVNSIKGKPLYIYFSNSINRIGTYLN